MIISYQLYTIDYIFPVTYHTTYTLRVDSKSLYESFPKSGGFDLDPTWQDSSYKDPHRKQKGSQTYGNSHMISSVKPRKLWEQPGGRGHGQRSGAGLRGGPAEGCWNPLAAPNGVEVPSPRFQVSGCCQKFGALFRSPYYTEHGILGSI